VAPELSTFAVADWLPLVSDDSGGPVIGTGPDRKIVLDGYELGWARADELSVDSAVQALTWGDPDALFVYLGNPDETSHQYESIGQEYREAIALADAHVGRLIAAMEGRASAGSENWLVLVSTDHGRTEDGDHGDASPEERTIFYLVSGPSVIPDTSDSPPQIVDVAVTALAHLGIVIDPVWRLDGRVRGIASGGGAGQR